MNLFYFEVQQKQRNCGFVQENKRKNFEPDLTQRDRHPFLYPCCRVFSGEDPAGLQPRWTKKLLPDTILISESTTFLFLLLSCILVAQFGFGRDNIFRRDLDLFSVFAIDLWPGGSTACTGGGNILEGNHRRGEDGDCGRAKGHAHADACAYQAYFSDYSKWTSVVLKVTQLS